MERHEPPGRSEWNKRCHFQTFSVAGPFQLATKLRIAKKRKDYENEFGVCISRELLQWLSQRAEALRRGISVEFLSEIPFHLPQQPPFGTIRKSGGALSKAVSTLRRKIPKAQEGHRNNGLLKKSPSTLQTKSYHSFGIGKNDDDSSGKSIVKSKATKIDPREVRSTERNEPRRWIH